MKTVLKKKPVPTVTGGTQAVLTGIRPTGEIAAWAEDDFRSINGQIEYLLSECVKQRKKGNKK